MKTNYLLAVALLLGLAACSNDETDNTGTENDNVVLFTGSIEGTHTRAYDQTWEGMDKIGITGTTGGVVYTNIPYKRDNTTFVVDDGQQAIYYQDDQTVTFTAYYPWNGSLTTTTTITANTWGQMDQRAFDFLYATAQGSKGSPVNFTFGHKMAKLVLIVKAGAGITYTDVRNAKCSLENFLYEGKFNRTTGIATATGATSGTWTFANNTTSGEEAFNTPTFLLDQDRNLVAYTLILFPQTFPTPDTSDLLTFTAETDGNEYSAAIDLSQVTNNGDVNELKPGTQYSITINLNKTGLTVGTSSISPWDEKSHEINASM